MYDVCYRKQAFSQYRYKVVTRIYDNGALRTRYEKAHQRDKTHIHLGKGYTVYVDIVDSIDEALAMMKAYRAAHAPQ